MPWLSVLYVQPSPADAADVKHGVEANGLVRRLRKEIGPG